MARQAEVISNIVERIILAETNELPATIGFWDDVTAKLCNVGWIESAGTYTAPPPDYRTILSGTEWTEAFTDQEWKWLKTQRAIDDNPGRRLDQMMDAIRWTNSIDVASSNIDEFYTWMLNQGIPGGQARIDVLREGIPEY